MKLATLGTLVIAVLVVASLIVAPDGEVFGQRVAGPQAARPAVSQGGLIALSSVVGGQYQQVIVLDSQAKTLTVYHIDLETGKSELKSAREIGPDLQLQAFNTEHPLPQEIRSMLENSR